MMKQEYLVQETSKKRAENVASFSRPLTVKYEEKREELKKALLSKREPELHDLVNSQSVHFSKQ